MTEKTAKEMAEKEYQKVVAKAITKLIVRKKRLQAENKKDNENFEARIEEIDKEIEGLNSGDITPDESSSFSDLWKKEYYLDFKDGLWRDLENKGKILGEVAAGGVTDDFLREKFEELKPYIRECCNYKKSYEQRQKEWVEKYDVKVGDKVKVTRSYEEFEIGDIVQAKFGPIDVKYKITNITSYSNYTLTDTITKETYHDVTKNDLIKIEKEEEFEVGDIVQFGNQKILYIITSITDEGSIYGESIDKNKINAAFQTYDTRDLKMIKKEDDNLYINEAVIYIGDGTCIRKNNPFIFCGYFLGRATIIGVHKHVMDSVPIKDIKKM